MRVLVGLIAAACIALALWQLEAARRGISITALSVGETPASIYRQPGVSGPVVVIAHGFAGSRQLMEAFALTFARAGYVAVSFDFQGHGRNPQPMGGDITRLDGTTQRLVAETAAVIDAVLALPEVSGPVALLGHSMATDIVIRQAATDQRIAAVVAVSMYSEAVTATVPERLLIVTGAFEGRLRALALEALRLVDPRAMEGETVEDLQNNIRRRAVAAPMVEHLGVLYSATSLREGRAWVDDTLGRSSAGPVAATGGWILLLLGGLLALAWPLAGLLPKDEDRPDRLAVRPFLAALLFPAVATPLLLTLVEVRLLPILLADYLLLHFLLYGAIALAVLYWYGYELGRFKLLATLALLIFALGGFGLALDRYAASFLPHAGRLPIILALAVGAVPFMVADSVMTEAGHAALWRRLLARLVFLASLGLAVALDFERLFFLLLILPVIVLFFLVFGLMGRWAGRRSGAPLSTGLALGLILAWALGVSFPIIAA